MNLYPPMKPKACVDDIRAFMENKELRGVVEKVLRVMRREVYQSCQSLKEARKSLRHAVSWKRSFRNFAERQE